jgi:hypothetical protein
MIVNKVKKPPSVKLMLLLFFSIIFEAENWTMEEIESKITHIHRGGEYYPPACSPR